MRRLVVGIVALLVIAIGAVLAYRQFVLLPLAREAVEARFPRAVDFKWRAQHIITPWVFNDDTLYCGEVAPRDHGKAFSEYRIFERFTNGHVEFYETWDDHVWSPACGEYSDLVPWWWLRW